MKIIKRTVIPLVFWLVVWQLAAWVVGKDLLLPGPWTVLKTLAALVVTARFWQITALTLVRIFAGMLAGAALGTLLAVLTCASVWCDRLLSPLVKVIRATPVASFILLVLLWVSTGRVPGVISALMVLPVLWGNVSKGIRETDQQLLELAAAYRFGRGRTLKLVYIPSVAPYFTAGVETGLGLAWKAGVAAEVLCRPKLAIGTQVYFSRTYMETPDLFAWTLVVILLSFLVETVLVRLLRKAVNGHGAH
ncbi:MAG: ABC transporter permease [Oscillospiraceae bacterium]